MNNEPVAWMVDGVLFTSLGAALNISFDIEQPCIPLYTHPVKELTEEKSYEVVFDGEKYTTKLVEPKVKELTDEEIEEVTNTIEWRESDWLWELDFARAILRKAQEK